MKSNKLKKSTELEVDKKIENLFDSLSVFAGYASVLSSNSPKVLQWLQEIDKTTRDLLGINFLSPLVQTCQRYYEVGRNEKLSDQEDKNTRLLYKSQESNNEEPSIGIITALPEEFNAVRVLFDTYIKIPTPKEIHVANIYGIGEISNEGSKPLKILLTMCGKGNNMAAIRCMQMTNAFKTIEHIIMCGIAGGVPSPQVKEDYVRLGDIVVSGEAGVLDYSFQKVYSWILNNTELQFQPQRIDPFLHNMDSQIKIEMNLANSKGEPYPWMEYVQKACKELNVSRPNKDILREFKPKLKWKEYILKLANVWISNPQLTNKEIISILEGTMEEINHPDQSDIGRREGEPLVFHGAIASANILLRDEMLRNQLLVKYGAKAVEEESSGIVDATWSEGKGYFTVRGIMDYCNLDKNDEWKSYAAIVAAAYTRLLLDYVAFSI